MFLGFLHRLVADNPRPVYLIVDHHTVHRAAAGAALSPPTASSPCSTSRPTHLSSIPTNGVKECQEQPGWPPPVIRPTDIVELATRALERLQHAPDTIRGFFQDPALGYITAVR